MESRATINLVYMCHGDGHGRFLGFHFNLGFILSFRGLNLGRGGFSGDHWVLLLLYCGTRRCHLGTFRKAEVCRPRRLAVNYCCRVSDKGPNHDRIYTRNQVLRCHLYGCYCLCGGFHAFCRSMFTLCGFYNGVSVWELRGEYVYTGVFMLCQLIGFLG